MKCHICGIEFFLNQYDLDFSESDYNSAICKDCSDKVESGEIDY